MARIDDYKQAFEIAKEEVIKKNPKRLADQAKGRFEPDKGGGARIYMDFLGKLIEIRWPELKITYSGTDEELPLQQRVLLLHYLQRLKGTVPSGEWIAYQEIPDGRFYLDAFHRRAKVPLIQAFGEAPRAMIELAKELFGGVEADKGDASVVVEALPHVPLMLVIWKGDEEFSPDGTILFDSTIKDLLSAEDVAWLSGMVVYPLVGIKKAREG